MSIKDEDYLRKLKMVGVYYDLQEEYEFNLEMYGWKAARQYYKDNALLYAKCYNAGYDNVMPEMREPHCYYAEGGQCDLECYWFGKQGCRYEGLDPR
jgi:hypothetical protein